MVASPRVGVSLTRRHCGERSDEAIHTFVTRWIASRSLSSGALSRDPLARNDEERIFLNPLKQLLNQRRDPARRQHQFVHDGKMVGAGTVSYTHLRAHETGRN